MNIIKATLAAALMTVSTFAFALVNINSASEAELTSLTGVGQTKAAAIVEYREAEGPFENVQDLDNVKGIGPATIEKNLDNLSVKNAK